MYQELREEVWKANCKLAAYGLATSTWGNVSGMDRQAGAVAIKPSGVPYDQLTADKIVVLDLEGNCLHGELQPSSDTPTHLELYRSFKSIGGISHTHSLYATMWAQACRALPCYGTTHADYFHGEVPLTEALTPEEIEDDYEINTGRVIVRRFSRLSVEHVPAVLVAHHGPFSWGPSAADAVEASYVLEQIAHMAFGTLVLTPHQVPLDLNLLEKHFIRRYGMGTYEGRAQRE